MNKQIEQVADKRVARPLKVLAPLIKDDLHKGDEAAREAGMPFYVAAGEKLLEAKSQLGAMSWGDWIQKNFHLSQRTAWQYMTAAKNAARSNITFRTASEAYGDTRHPGHRPDWHEPVSDVMKNLRAEKFNLDKHYLTQSKERQLERKLALQLIDIGYKVLSVKLHPDKGGSHDGMQRLNKVRTRLKGAA